MRRRTYLSPLLWLGLLWLLLAACGPAAQRQDAAPDNQPAADETGPTVNQDSGEAAGDTQSAAFETIADRTVIGEDGIEIGFTVDGRPYRGDPAAPVLIEEFSDYQCPFCGRFFSQTWPSLNANYLASGEVAVVFYDFPLESIHPQARAAAAAARCAGQQETAAYWEMHDLLFNNMSQWGNSQAEQQFSSYAGQLGLDLDTFKSCLTSAEVNAAIDADLQVGSARGVRGTPAFFVNGNLLAGAQPMAAFDQMIALAKSGESGQPGVASGPSSGAPETGLVTAADVVVPPPAQFSDNYSGAMGAEDAPVTIVEFTDYQCPFCQRHSLQTMPQIIAELIDSGQVHYVLKDLPLDSIHPEAREAAVAARCAGEQSLYWEMHDAIFARQSEWSGQGDETALTQLKAIAADVGLDSGAFADCLASGRYDQAIQENYEEATGMGINGTPFFFVQGYPLINGAQPYERFQVIVDLALRDELVNALAEAIAAQENARRQQQQADAQPTGPVDVPIGDAPTLGNPDAPVVIVEYTDYQCPFCSRHFAQTYPQIVENFVNTGQVLYVFKDFPLTSIHPQAQLASEAARCAHDQGAFLGMHDTLFEKQEEWSTPRAEELFVGYAASLGLDTAVFAECLSSRKYQSAVQADLNEGLTLGVRGTPAFFVNGYFVNGAQPYEVFVREFETRGKTQ